MGLLGSIDDFFVAQGQQAGSFLKGALSQAADFACQLHYTTPGVIFDLNPVNRGLWQELCVKRPAGLPPPPPPPQFSGGQCPVVYEAYLGYDSQGTTYTNVRVGQYFGAILDARRAPSNNRPDLFDAVQFLCYGKYSDSSSRPFSQPQWLEAVGVPRRGFTYYKVERLVRIDGKPDNCGNPPAPVVKPVVLPPEQRTTNINVTNLDNTVTNVNVALGFPSASVDFGLSVPLTVNLGGVKFYLNIDGWYIGSPAPPVSLPDVEKVLSDNVLRFEGTLNQYFAPVNPSTNNNLILVSPSAGKKKGGEEKNVPGAQWLIWDLTRLPDKAQYGENSPTVYFAGWFSFYKEGRCMERRQINYERGIVRFPDGADGYGYTFTNGAEGDVSVYKEKSQDG